MASSARMEQWILTGGRASSSAMAVLLISSAWSSVLPYTHSEYKADVDMPRIHPAAANELFLGPLLGYDDDGYAIYGSLAAIMAPANAGKIFIPASVTRSRPI